MKIVCVSFIKFHSSNCIFLFVFLEKSRNNGFGSSVRQGGEHGRRKEWVVQVNGVVVAEKFYFLLVWFWIWLNCSILDPYSLDDILLDHICNKFLFNHAITSSSLLGLHRILNWPDIRPPDIRPICFAGYPVSGRISGLAGYPVSGRISGLIVKGFHQKTNQLTFFSITFYSFQYFTVIFHWALGFEVRIPHVKFRNDISMYQRGILI